MHRRNFIRAISGTFLILSNGLIVRAGNFADKKVIFRFAVASDGHYGEANTDFSSYYKSLVESLNNFNTGNPLHAIVINEDIIHNEPALLPEAAKELEQLQIPFYVTRGNQRHAYLH